MLSIAPALRPDEVLAMGVCRAFALLGARRRLTSRSLPRGSTDASGRGREAISTLDRFMLGGGGDTWTDAKGHRHTKINSMASLYALMPRRE